MLAKNGDFAGALAQFEAAAIAAPGLPEAWFFIGVTLSQLGRDADALEPLYRAYRLAPTRVEVLGTLAYTEFRLGRLDAAISLLQALVRARPRDMDSRLKLGDALSRAGRPAEAAAVFRAATAGNEENGELWMALAQAEDEAGDRDAAVSGYRRALALRPGWVQPLAGLLALLRGRADDEVIALARRTIENPGLDDAGTAVLGYALGKALDARGDHAGAMAAWQRANEARRREAGPMDRDGLAARVAAGLAVDAATVGPPHGSDDPRPVFVVGMLRSGTTLVEQIIATHPLAAGCGELPTLPAIASAPGEPRADAQRYLDAAVRRGGAEAQRLVDKLPLNFFHLDVAARLFPNAHVVWCRRDARDVALSNFSENTARQFAFTTDLDDIALYQDAHDRLMRHWQDTLPLPILEVDYESLVTDIEPQARRLIEFLGLPWDPACLAFHENKRAVQTPSRWQVRQPVHTGSIGRWRHYEEWFR